MIIPKRSILYACWIVATVIAAAITGELAFLVVAVAAGAALLLCVVGANVGETP